MSIFTAKRKKQCLCVHRQKITTASLKIAQTAHFYNHEHQLCDVNRRARPQLGILTFLSSRIIHLKNVLHYSSLICTKIQFYKRHCCLYTLFVDNGNVWTGCKLTKHMKHVIILGIRSIMFQNHKLSSDLTSKS